MEESIETGGNKLQVWLGNKLLKRGNKLIAKGKKKIARGNKTIITNPSCVLKSPWILVISFTVDTTQKYQILFEGDYRIKYKDHGDTVDFLLEKEIFTLILNNKHKWYLKTK